MSVDRQRCYRDRDPLGAGRGASYLGDTEEEQAPQTHRRQATDWTALYLAALLLKCS